MNVIISAAQRSGKQVFHKPGCSYVKRMKPWNRMAIDRKKAIKKGYCSCNRCRGIQVALKTDPEIQQLVKQGVITTDYNRKTDTLYIRTDIGCWKVFTKDDPDGLYLFHKNVYRPDMTLKTIQCGEYHRQTDVPISYSLVKLVHYLVDHDRAKAIIQKDYRKLPRATGKQRHYYKQAEKRHRRQQLRNLDNLFRQLEAKDPAMKQYSFC
jgi:hypothetical protein